MNGGLCRATALQGCSRVFAPPAGYLHATGSNAVAHRFPGAARMSRMMLCLCLAGFFSLTIASADDKPNTAKPNGNRLTYLDEPCNPWYPHRDFPKLTTPMLRADLDEFVSWAKSFMPEGLEKDITPRELSRRDRLRAVVRSAAEEVRRQSARSGDRSSNRRSRTSATGAASMTEPSGRSTSRSRASIRSAGTTPATTAPPATRLSLKSRGNRSKRRSSAPARGRIIRRRSSASLIFRPASIG